MSNGSNGVQVVRVAFQMDPITKVDPKADSTFRLAEEAQLRGYSLFYYEPDKLTLEDGRAIASGHFFEITQLQKKKFLHMYGAEMFIPRQSLKGVSRFITDELSKLSEEISNSAEKAIDIELKIFE